MIGALDPHLIRRHYINTICCSAASPHSKQYKEPWFVPNPYNKIVRACLCCVRCAIPRRSVFLLVEIKHIFIVWYGLNIHNSDRHDELAAYMDGTKKKGMDMGRVCDNRTNKIWSYYIVGNLETYIYLVQNHCGANDELNRAARALYVTIACGNIISGVIILNDDVSCQTIC